MRYNPKPPPVLQTGQYHPVQLLNFLKTADAHNIMPWKVARILRVSVDRATYALGPGRPYLERRAIQYLAETQK